MVEGRNHKDLKTETEVGKPGVRTQEQTGYLNKKEKQCLMSVWHWGPAILCHKRTRLSQTRTLDQSLHSSSMHKKQVGAGRTKTARQPAGLGTEQGRGTGVVPASAGCSLVLFWAGSTFPGVTGWAPSSIVWRASCYRLFVLDR